MLLTFSDVIGRYFFTTPIPFTVEITELLMGLVILLGLGLTTLREGHIAVDVVTRSLPGRLQRYLARVARICGFFCLAVVTWQLFKQTLMVYSDGLYTQVLGVYVYPFAAVMTVAAAFSCIIALWVLIRKSQGSNNGSA